MKNNHTFKKDFSCLIYQFEVIYNKYRPFCFVTTQNKLDVVVVVVVLIQNQLHNSIYHYTNSSEDLDLGIIVQEQ